MFSLTRTSLRSVSSAGPSRRCASSLVFIEYKGSEINPGSLSAITAASKIGGDVNYLSNNLSEQMLTEVSQVDGIVTGSEEQVKGVEKAASG